MPIQSAPKEAQSPVRRLSLAAPVYNEVENVPLLYAEVVRALEPLGIDWELILVDDGSRDGTRDILAEIAERDPRVKVLFFKRNYGQTAAMQAGFHYATGEVVVMMDADLQNDPADVPKLLAKLEEGYDVVSGWRKDRKDKAFTRRLPSRIANRIIARASGVQLHDYGCSLKAYRTEFVRDIRLYGEMHRFIPIYCKWEGARITEVPVNHRARIHGQGKYGLGRTMKVVFDLILVRFMEKYWQKPIYVFGRFAMRMLLLALLCVGLAVTSWFVPRLGPPAVWGVGAILSGGIGVLGYLLGLVAEMNNRIYYESQGKPTYKVARAFNLEPERELV